jgi:hypothetical protein
MIRNFHRLIAAGVISATLAAGSAFGQFQPPRPPADVQQGPLPPPQQQPLPPPQPQPKQQAQPKQQVPELPPELKQAPAKAEKKAPTKTKQKQKDGKELPPPTTTPETMTQTPEGERIANPTAAFSGLDKISGRIIVFDVAIGETVQFGALQVTPRACYTRPPTETQNTTAFVEVDEITLKAEIRRIFSGWMFANSPGLNAVEHPIYDVWLIDCKTTPPSTTPSEGQQ